jgi:hypothetical protein
MGNAQVGLVYLDIPCFAQGATVTPRKAWPVK